MSIFTSIQLKTKAATTAIFAWHLHFHYRSTISSSDCSSAYALNFRANVYYGTNYIKKIYNFAPDIEDIVGTDQHLPQTAGAVVVDVLICVGQMEVHVLVGGHEVALEGEKNCYNCVGRAEALNILTLYSVPHFSLTTTSWPVRAFRNGFGLVGGIHPFFIAILHLENIYHLKNVTLLSTVFNMMFRSVTKRANVSGHPVCLCLCALTLDTSTFHSWKSVPVRCDTGSLCCACLARVCTGNVFFKQ